MPDLHDRMLGWAFVSGDFVFASGKEANNKLKSERLAYDPELFEEVVVQVGNLALRSNPDAITYVPDGGRLFVEGADAPPKSGNFVEGIAPRLGIPIIHVKKVPNSVKRFAFADKDSETLAKKSSRKVIFEDALNSRLSTLGVISLEGIQGTVVSVVGLLDRGVPDEKKELPVESHVLVEESMPAMMSDEELGHYLAIVKRIQKS